MSLYPVWDFQIDLAERVRREEDCEELWWRELGSRAASFVEAARAEARGKAREAVRLSCASADGFRECRRCVGCLRKRSARWIARSRQEWFSAERVWWVTLTYRGASEVGYEEVKRWLKKVRGTGVALRYLCSEERGERHGRRHFHMLIFTSRLITKRLLQSKWTFGFSKVVLARTLGVVKYLSKYLSKGGSDEVGRIRASVGFGNGLLALRRARPDLCEVYDSWLFGDAGRPEWVVQFGPLIRQHRIGDWWLSPPF